MVEVAVGALALVLCLIALSSPKRRESRFLALAIALLLLAGSVWEAYRNDRWWILLVGVAGAALWIALEEWLDRKEARQAP